MIQIGSNQLHEECAVVCRGDIYLTTSLKGVVIHSGIESLEFGKDSSCSLRSAHLNTVSLEHLDESVNPLEVSIGALALVTLEDQFLNLAVDFGYETINDELLKWQGFGIGIGTDKILRPLSNKFLWADGDQHLDPGGLNLTVSEGHISSRLKFAVETILEGGSDLKIVEILLEFHARLNADSVADAATHKTKVLEEQVTVFLHIGREGGHDEICSWHNEKYLSFFVKYQSPEGCNIFTWQRGFSAGCQDPCSRSW